MIRFKNARNLMMRILSVVLSLALFFPQMINAGNLDLQEISNAMDPTGLKYSINRVDGKTVISFDDAEGAPVKISIIETPSADGLSAPSAILKLDGPPGLSVSVELNQALMQMQRVLDMPDPAQAKPLAAEIMKTPMQELMSKVGNSLKTLGKGTAWVLKSSIHNIYALVPLAVVLESVRFCAFRLYSVHSDLSSIWGVAQLGLEDMASLIGWTSLWVVLVGVQDAMDGTSFFKGIPNLHKIGPLKYFGQPILWTKAQFRALITKFKNRNSKTSTDAMTCEDFISSSAQAGAR